MDQPYSAFADLLSKFHTSSEWIQALWLIAVPATVLGLARCVADVLKAALTRRSPPPPPVVQGLLTHRDGHWLLGEGGEARTANRVRLAEPEEG